MIRVLFISDTLMAGGTEQQMTALIRWINRSRIAPYVLCFYGKKAQRSLHFLPTLQALNVPVQVLDVGWSPIGKLRALIGIVRATWRLRPDILHAINYHGNLLFRLARPFLPPRTRLIGSVQVEYTPKQLLYERLSGWLCGVIVVNSPHLAHQLTEIANLRPARVALIHNGVDLMRFSRPPENPALDLPAGRLAVMFGRVSRQKSPHILAQAIGILKARDLLPPNFRLILVGESEDRVVQAELDTVIRQHHLADQVIQHGRTAQPEAYYHAADFTVLPSLYEGLPNVMLESLAAGRPVLITEGANAAGVIQDGVTGWIARTGDADHLAEVLLRALHTDVESMREACRATAAEFSMEKMVERYTALYERLAGYSTA